MLATSRLWTTFPAFVWTCWRHWRSPHAETCWRLTWRRKWQRRGGRSGHAQLLWFRSSLIQCSSQLCAQLQCPQERDLSVPVCAHALVCAHTNDLIHCLEIMTFTNSFPTRRMGENSRCTTFAVLWAFLWCYLCVFQDHVSEFEGQVTSKVMAATQFLSVSLPGFLLFSRPVSKSSVPLTCVTLMLAKKGPSCCLSYQPVNSFTKLASLMSYPHLR